MVTHMRRMRIFGTELLDEIVNCARESLRNKSRRIIVLRECGAEV